MKTKFFFRPFTCQVCLWAWLGTILSVQLSAQDLEQLISSKFEVIDDKDHQLIDCNTYKFADEILYDNPNVVRLYENGAYRFDFRFSYFGKDEVINQTNYLNKFYSVQIPASAQENYRITAISPSGDKLSIFAIATGNPGIQDTFRIQLLDKDAELLADAIYPFEVVEDRPGTVETAYLPMKIEYQPIFVSLEEVDNPNNRIERQLLPFGPDTVNVDAKTAYNLITEIEQDVQLNGQSYVLVANHENNYGYEVNFKWEGKGLQYKPASENGMKSYLTTVPGRGRPVITQLNLTEIMVADLKKAGLDQGGKRVKQEFVFEEPKANLRKVYRSDYLKQNPGVTRSRTDQRTNQYLIQKHMPKVRTDLKEANLQVLKYYQMDNQQKAQLQKTYPANANTRVQTDKPKENKAVIRNQRYNTAVIKDNRTKPSTNTKVQGATVVRPKYEVTKTPPPPRPNDNFYTLAIEVSRKTDVMTYRTYFLTLRVIE